MCSHDHWNPVQYCLLERNQLELLQFPHRLLDDWKLKMGIHRGIAVAWKMSGTAQDSGTCQPLRHLHSKASHFFRIFSIASDTYGRIVRIAVDIENWSKIDIDTHRRKLLSSDPTTKPCIFRIVGCPQCHCTWDICKILRKHTGFSTLLIDNDERFDSCLRGNKQTQLKTQSRQLLPASDVPPEKNHITDLVFSY